MAVSAFASGSLTNATSFFWVAQETSVLAATSSRPAEIQGLKLRIRVSIDDDVSRLHLNASRQRAGHDIADSRCRFNRRNANFSNVGAVSHNQHFGMRFDSVAAAKVKDNKIVSLVYGEHFSLHANLPMHDGAPLFFVFELSGAFGDGLHFFRKKALFPLCGVKLLASIIKLGL